ncbi:hypothetical protein IVB03_33310 [Bradyrhizobium sp. 168]|uniref:hypothetical protein n=1 Tax=Bradyrhizobium sp. 168 TaxID=2782639 RepID=UPI001FF7D90D|nr:hypothetical protein [Bradyrhizobium sp. 168]MCK1584291.1 hypothetical protein [Bradyrhizobium sp. 168]
MFNRPVVFVIGAGASADYDMPLGGTLASTIAEDVNFRFRGNSRSEPIRGDNILYELLVSKFNKDGAQLDSYVAAGHKLAAAISSAASVDDALYQLSEFPEAIQLGKACIIRSILKAERNSALKFSPDTGRLPDSAGKDGWIEQVLSIAIAGLRHAQFPEAFKKVTFVNFNYDRCLEHYLFWSFQRLGLSADEATKIVDGLTIIRPYGTVGSVLDGRLDHVPFGDGSRLDVFNMLDRIRTFTESDALHDKEQLERLLSEAFMCVFLGFGFHKQNLDLLARSKNLQKTEVPRILATIYKVHDGNLPALTTALADRLRVNNPRIELLPMKAPELLQELRLRLTLVLG